MRPRLAVALLEGCDLLGALVLVHGGATQGGKRLAARQPEGEPEPEERQRDGEARPEGGGAASIPRDARGSPDRGDPERAKQDDRKIGHGASVGGRPWRKRVRARPRAHACEKSFRLRIWADLSSGVTSMMATLPRRRVWWGSVGLPGFTSSTPSWCSTI